MVSGEKLLEHALVWHLNVTTVVLEIGLVSE